MSNEKLLDISWETIFKIFITVLSFYILYLIRDVLVFFIFALIISVLFSPIIDFLQRRKISRALAVIFTYLFVFGLITALVYLTIPVFISEIKNFLQILPQYFEEIAPPLKGIGIQAFESLESFINLVNQALVKVAANIFNALFAIFGGILSTVFILSIAIFLSLEERPIEKTLSLLFPKKYEAYVLELWQRCQMKVSSWFLSTILGCFFVGLSSYLAFSLLNIKYPFSLGLLAGILDFIPIVGPIFTAVFIFIIVSLDNLLKAIFVLIVFTLIQQIENNIVLPLLIKKFVGLSPVLVLLALTIGGKLWGILGAILTLPLAGILFEFTRDFLKKRKEEAAAVL